MTETVGVDPAGAQTDPMINVGSCVPAMDAIDAELSDKDDDGEAGWERCGVNADVHLGADVCACPSGVSWAIGSSSSSSSSPNFLIAGFGVF